DHKSKRNSCEVSIYNLRQTAISFGIFVRAEYVKLFRFDERFGINAEYGSAEESDLLLFLIKNHNKGFYNANRVIYHPHKLNNIERAFTYGKGLGALYRKGIVVYKFHSLFFVFLVVLAKCLTAFVIFPLRKIRLASFRGRVFGFFHYRVDPPCKEKKE
ncbi:MAG: hypothetical protein LBN21_02240, partial [Treponema sp.]|nr:hypothetical protein [Treponema sp.]